MVNIKIKKLRSKLDKLDNKMLLNIKKRKLLVDQVLSNKTKKKQIIDKKRIKIILKNIKIKSKIKNIDPDITASIWKSMIRAFVKYEYKNFGKK